MSLLMHGGANNQSNFVSYCTSNSKDDEECSCGQPRIFLAFRFMRSSRGQTTPQIFVTNFSHANDESRNISRPFFKRRRHPLFRMILRTDNEEIYRQQLRVPYTRFAFFASSTTLFKKEHKSTFPSLFLLK